MWEYSRKMFGKLTVNKLHFCVVVCLWTFLTRNISPCVLHMWKTNSGKYVNPILQTFSGVHVCTRICLVCHGWESSVSEPVSSLCSPSSLFAHCDRGQLRAAEQHEQCRARRPGERAAVVSAQHGTHSAQDVGCRYNLSLVTSFVHD